MVKVVLGVRLFVVRLDCRKFEPFWQPSCASMLKGDLVAAAINSMSFSFMVAMARRKSSTGIPSCSPGASPGCLFRVTNY